MTEHFYRLQQEGRTSRAGPFGFTCPMQVRGNSLHSSWPWLAGRQADRQASRLAGRQIDRKTDRQCGIEEGLSLWQLSGLQEFLMAIPQGAVWALCVCVCVVCVCVLAYVRACVRSVKIYLYNCIHSNVKTICLLFRLHVNAFIDQTVLSESSAKLCSKQLIFYSWEDREIT